MSNTPDAVNEHQIDEELADVLIAISVITKRLARKIMENLMTKKETSNEQNLRTDRKDGQSSTQK